MNAAYSAHSCPAHFWERHICASCQSVYSGAALLVTALAQYTSLSELVEQALKQLWSMCLNSLALIQNMLHNASAGDVVLNLD